MFGENEKFDEIVDFYINNPHDVLTNPIRNVQKRWFYVSGGGAELYVEKAESHEPSCEISWMRTLPCCEFDVMWSIYLDRKAGYQVGEDARNCSVNSTYWFGVFADLEANGIIDESYWNDN